MLKKLFKKAHNNGDNAKAHGLKCFIHIPKTAGTSFKRSLEKKYPSGLYWDYGKSDAETHKLVKTLWHRQQDLFLLKSRLQQQQAHFIGGHVPLKRFAGFATLADTLTLLREPGARVISHYKHKILHHQQKLSFEAFIEQPLNQNIQSKYINVLPLAAVGIVGLTERYSELLTLVQARWGITLEEYNENRAVAFENGQFDDIDFERWSGRVAELNKDDFSLYRDGQRIVTNSLFYQARGLADCRAFCTPFRGRNTISGWGMKLSGHAPLRLAVVVNGQSCAVVSCTEPRPQLAAYRAPRDGYLGFTLKQRLSDGDRVELVDEESGTVLHAARAGDQ